MFNLNQWLHTRPQRNASLAKLETRNRVSVTKRNRCRLALSARLKSIGASWLESASLKGQGRVGRVSRDHRQLGLSIHFIGSAWEGRQTPQQGARVWMQWRREHTLRWANLCDASRVKNENPISQARQ
jgi:hypothetical protein